jgi:hypothetical protein
MVARGHARWKNVPRGAGRADRTGPPSDGPPSSEAEARPCGRKAEPPQSEAALAILHGYEQDRGAGLRSLRPGADALSA